MVNDALLRGNDGNKKEQDHKREAKNRRYAEGNAKKSKII